MNSAFRIFVATVVVIGLAALGGCFGFDQAYDNCAAGKTCSFSSDGGAGGGVGGSDSGVGGGAGGGVGGGAGGGAGGVDAGPCGQAGAWCVIGERGIGSGLPVTSVSAASADVAWAGGQVQLYEWTAGSWIIPSKPTFADSDYRAVCSTPTAAFVGDWNLDGIYMNSGSGWSTAMTGTDTFFPSTIAALPDGGSMYAGAYNEVLLHLEGSQWSVIAFAGTQAESFRRMFVIGPDDVIAVSSSKKTVRIKNKVASDLGFASGSESPQAVWASGPDDLWIGTDSAIFRTAADGGWTSVGPNGVDVADLFGTGPADVYAALFSGDVLHWNGQSWNSIYSRPGANFYGMSGDGHDTLFVSGIFEDGGGGVITLRR